MHPMLQSKCIGTANDHVCYNLSVVYIRVHTCRINAQEATPTYPLSLCGAYGLQCRKGPMYAVKQISLQQVNAVLNTASTT